MKYHPDRPREKEADYICAVCFGRLEPHRVLLIKAADDEYFVHNTPNCLLHAHLRKMVLLS